MKRIDDLYNALSERGVMFFNYAAIPTAAVSMQDKYTTAIFVNERLVHTTADEKAVVAHEAGHIMTGALHPYGAPETVIRRDEYRAVKYAVHDLINPEDIVEAQEEGDTEIWQMADRFNLPEDFVREAIYIYQCEGKL